MRQVEELKIYFCKMHITYNDEELSIFTKIAEAGEEIKTPVYLIGGVVRDKLLGRPTKDADIVCVGDGLALAKKAASYFTPTPNVSFFKNFGTAQFRLEDGLEIEFVGARKESYQVHSRNPEVV